MSDQQSSAQRFHRAEKKRRETALVGLAGELAKRQNTGKGAAVKV